MPNASVTGTRRAFPQPRIRATLRKGIIRAGIALALGCMTHAPAEVLAQDGMTDLQKEILELHRASADSSRAPSIVPRVREILAGDLEEGYVGFVRQILLRAMIYSGAPAPQLEAAADSVVPYLVDNPRVKVQFFGLVARALMAEPKGFDGAYRYAQRALDACPEVSSWAPLRAECMTLIGEIQVARGEIKPAVEVLTKALGASPDSQRVLLTLAGAYEREGSGEKAIDTYVRALGVFPCRDTSATASLRALYRKHDKGLAEMEARIDEACRASRKLVALDSRRHDAPAPYWELPDPNGKLVRDSDFENKIVVIDFWGSWCGPCRAELPYFQALYERYKDREDVAFLGISWEKAPTKDARIRAAMGFMQQMNLDFPTVIDHDRQAVIGFGVEAFPTVYLIDRDGRVRYRNVGFSPQIEDILTAQLESLMD